MAYKPEEWTTVGSWMSVCGAFLAFVGSSARAWFTFQQLPGPSYRLALSRKEKWHFRALLIILFPVLTFMFLRLLFSPVDEEDRKEIAEVRNQFIGWSLVLLGSLGGLGSAVIKLINTSG
ncbi:hypothetical protein [Streptomyces griseocarneus]|uniref:hypothetical protein n=1 Tax=Streptomyces griseocarneus TaxID=51201 RepID=UPI00167CF366|nr:hypothetical protein [Streptomyces griseocarneus]MBZ6476231.1 hypothetical protein [Streptomyces griseocarneus]GHG63209.1 hypothetical protein GCM10018779_32590 [Streptomyces griseocarneus]